MAHRRKGLGQTKGRLGLGRRGPARPTKTHLGITWLSVSTIGEKHLAWRPWTCNGPWMQGLQSGISGAADEDPSILCLADWNSSAGRWVVTVSASAQQPPSCCLAAERMRASIHEMRASIHQVDAASVLAQIEEGVFIGMQLPNLTPTLIGIVRAMGRAAIGMLVLATLVP